MSRLALCFLSLFCFARLTAQTVPEAEVPMAALTWDTLCQKMADLFIAGKYEAAAVYSGAALDLARRDSGEASLAYGTSLDNHGVVLNHAGRLKEALPYLEAAVAHGRLHLGERHEDYITRLSNLGMLRRDLGDRAMALTHLEEAVVRGESVLGPDHADFGILLNNFALVSEESGLFDQALRLYQRTLEVTEKTAGKDSPRYATRLNNLASLQFRLGRYDQALELYEQSLVIVEKKSGKTHPHTINVLLNIANAHFRLGQHELALAQLLELLPQSEKAFGKEHTDYLNVMSMLARSYQAVGRSDQAIAAYRENLELWERLFPKAYKGKKQCALGLAQAYESQGNTGRTVQFALLINRYLLEEIDDQFDQLSQAEQLAYFRSNDNIYEGQFLSFVFRHREQAVLTQAAFDNNLVLKGQFIGNHRRMLQSLRESSDASLQNRFVEWLAVTETINRQYNLAPARRAATFDSLLLRANELERLLAQTSAPFRQSRQAISWRDVQARLAPGEAAIEFDHFRYWDRDKMSDSTLYVAYLLRPGDPAPRQIFLFEAKQLGALQATRRLYSADAQGGEATLRQLIWNPLAPYLDGISTIYYAASGLLHRVNFGAIPLDNNAVVADRFQLHNLGSTRQLCLETKRPERPAAALVFGGVRYETDSLTLAAGGIPPTGHTATSPALPASRAGNWDYLPWTATEADMVADRLQRAGASVQLKKGFAATEAYFKQIGQQHPAPAVLHLATHGYFFPDTDRQAASGFQASDNPLIRSGLILAGANRVWLGGDLLPGQEDGILTAYEIAQMDLHDTRLVVLSACETGLGDLNGAEGVYGLQRAFKIAGARYLIMTLWSVQDRQTHEFMDLFYRAWLAGEQDIPAAFKTAQNQLHKKYAKPFNPALWAGFILVE